MIRADILKEIIPVITDKLVVSNIGLPSQELHMLDDQPTNFYMLGTMFPECRNLAHTKEIIVLMGPM